MAMLIEGNGTLMLRELLPQMVALSEPYPHLEKKFPLPGKVNFRLNQIDITTTCMPAHGLIRTLIYRALLNLEDIIDLSIVHPISYPNGWTFEKYASVSNNAGLNISYLGNFICIRIQILPVK